MRRTSKLHQILAILPAAALFVAVFLGGLSQPRRAWSDDRDLFSVAGDRPYVFFVVDISSSMKKVIDGECSLGTNDTPLSRVYQAKKAIYEVVKQSGNRALYGFATYDARDIEIGDKHWLYSLVSNPSWITDPASPLFDPNHATSSRPWLGPGTPEVVYPRVGHYLQFGDDDGPRGSTHDRDDPAQVAGDHTDGSCSRPEVLDEACDKADCSDSGCCGEDKDVNWTDTEALGRLWMFAKLGTDGQTRTRQWFQYGGRKYRLTWNPLTGGQQMGDTTLTVNVRLQRDNGSCSGSYDLTWNEDLNLEPTFTVDLDGDPLFGPSEHIGSIDSDDCFFETEDYDERGACQPGNWWNGNFDDIGDYWSYDVIADPLGRDPVNNTCDRGDMIPLDWTNPGYATGNRREILNRMAPNMTIGEAVPDFRVGRYFKDPADRIAGVIPLKDAFVNQPPIITSGGTPVAGSIFQFRSWYDDWVEIASVQDPNFFCRDVNLIVLTDGGESCDDYGGVPTFCDGATVGCPNDGAAQSQILFDAAFPAGHPMAGDVRGVKTWVVGFAFAKSILNTIAENGGTCFDRDGDGLVDPNTECAFFPTTKDELVTALLNIFSSINVAPRTFVPAASPPSSINAEDKIALTNFVPVPGQSTWDGHIRAFLKPLPIAADGKPDTSQTCGGPVTEGCFLWDAGEVMESQAPTAAEVAPDPPNLKIGGSSTQRRVWYGQAPANPDDLPLPRRLLDFPTLDPDWDDLLTGMGLALAERPRAQDVIRQTLKIKEATIPDPDTGLPIDIQYILGDIFHSAPVVMGAPSNARFFALDFKGDGTGCSAGNPGYRCFFEKHRFRRQLLLTASNDNQLHAFDLARFVGDPDTGSFVNGTGSELFSVIPRSLLPNLLDQAESTDHDWGLDGSVRVSDVFIDPVHTGVPTAAEREWRTVGIGGLRRGGRAYYALDLTQPDKLDAQGVPQPVSIYVPSCWNEGGTPDCGPLAYATELWELTDTWDEDNNGQPDLGDTWSSPNTGLLRVDVGGTIEGRFVAVFGGGLDPQKLGRLGNWLYIADIENGKVIYKRQLSSSAASEPAAVDTNQDGFLDTIYIPTVDGFLYKVDVSQPQLLITTTVDDYSTPDPGTGVPPLTRTVDRITSLAWDPFVIFDTGGRPVYFPPSVIFVAKLGRYSVAFGTGEREDILATTSQVGRFYNFVDDNFAPGDPRLPLTETDLQAIDADVGVTPNTTQDFLISPDVGKERGWFLILDAEERLVTKTFALSGIVTFSSFNPILAPSGCGGSGTARVYILLATNANSVLEEGGSETRFFEVADFVTNPFTELSEPPDTDSPGPEPCAGQEALTQTLTSLFPQTSTRCS